MKQNFVNQGMKDAKNLDLPLDMFKEQAERRVKLGQRRMRHYGLRERVLAAFDPKSPT